MAGKDTINYDAKRWWSSEYNVGSTIKSQKEQIATLEGSDSTEESFEIHPRKYKVALYELDKDLNPVESEGIGKAIPVCDISSMAVTYTLNSIPYATVTPVAGIPIAPENTDFASTIKDVYAILSYFISQRTPLGIAIEWADTNSDGESVGFSMTSEGNISDDSREELWPGSSTFIFKGYPTAIQIQRADSSIAINLTMQHWLIDLSRITMFNPRVIGSNSEIFALKWGNGLIKDQAQNRYAQILKVPKGNEFTCKSIVDTFKDVITMLINDKDLAKADDLFGSVDPVLVENVIAALDKIEVPSEVNFSEIIQKNCIQLWQLIEMGLLGETADTWMAITAWDKLLRSYLPMFHLAVSPCVDKAYIIPQPCVIPDEDDIPFELNEDNLFDFKCIEPEKPLISGVCTTSLEGHSAEARANGLSSTRRYACMTYPVITEFVKTGGPIKLIDIPVWLNSDVFTRSPVATELAAKYQLKPTDRDKEVTDAEALNQIVNDAATTALYEYCKYSYLTEVLNGKALELSVPFSARFSPGSVIKVTIKENKKQNTYGMTVYGTVETLNLVASEGQFVTRIVLNNVRSEQDYNNEIINPKTKREGGYDFGLFNIIWPGEMSICESITDNIKIMKEKNAIIEEKKEDVVNLELSKKLASLYSSDALME